MSGQGLTLINDLNRLKNKLEEMDKDIVFQTKNIGVRDKYWDEMQEAMKSTAEINKSKNSLIKIDCGGEKFQTAKSTLVNEYARQSLLEAVVNDSDFDLSQELFFDRDPRYFSTILEYLRSGNINYKVFTKEEKKKLMEEARYYQIIGILSYLEERMKEVDFVSFEFTGAYTYKGKTAGSNILEDIKNPDLKVGGICSASPGSIVIKLNSDWEFSEIEIGGYKGDATLWYPENGCGAQILTSENGKDFKKVGKIPSGYGKDVKKVKLTKSVGRYIKFQHTSYVGISYLKIFKLDDE